MISRRNLFASTVAAGLTAPLSPFAALTPRPPRFRFVHFSDLHIQPELGATDGVALAVKKVLALHPRPDFILTGGDHVMDLLKVTRERANLQFKLLAEALAPLNMPVYSTVGNHDIYGWSTSSPATESDPEYGKQLFRDKFARENLYRSFEHKDWHFVILDTIQPRGRDWYLGVDDDQLTWLKKDLEEAKGKPIVVLTHAPILTAFIQYTEGATKATPDTLILSNGLELQALFAKHSVKAVLQGHTHVVEEIQYAGTKYVTGGAVSGDWWKGWRLGIHPEGFAVYDVVGQEIDWHYETYGWKARPA
jgi:3',5'-cyclic-AMP phosphodiesterase